MEIEKEHSFKRHVLENGINLFLGAGFSYDASNSKKEQLPLGNDLKDLLIKEFALEEYKTLSLSQISNIIKSSQRNEFHRFLHDRYRVTSFSPSYKFLDKLNIKNIFTINIDNLIERIYEGDDTDNLIYDVSISGVIDNSGIDFHKLHGSITYPIEKELYFTPEELSILFTKEPAWFHGIALKMASKPTLFWGTQIEDANVLTLLSTETTKSFGPNEKWVLVTPEKEKDATAKYFQSMNFNIIRGYTNELLTYFNTISSAQLDTEREITPSEKSFSLINKHFSSNYLQNILGKEHPVRPLSSFFSGDDPVWSDIIDDKIIKLSFYNECIAKIYKNNFLFITGGVGTGKSTILMQLAVDKEFKGVKFYFNSLTRVKAVMLDIIARELEGKKYLFIDNISNNLDAFLYLREKGNFTIICADRDFNYDMIKHFIKLNNEEIIDITELQNKDIQSVCDLAHNTTFRNYKNKMSLFELAYYIWEGKQLSTKIDNLIQTLSGDKKYIDLLEFFTLMTYIRSSGISASMDMLLLYYSDDNLHYSKIYEFVKSLRSMIDDKDHFTINEDQDFFTLRSRLFAELSLKKLPPEILEFVLMKFINNVHKDLIVRYDVFMRKGFDADIALRAFVDVEQGKEFYEKIILMDPSEYRYQQYALYLFRKHHFKDAWIQIEQARSMNPYNLAVKNTHAYILFQNNINIKEDIETVKETVEDTFNVIESCISKDLRTTFHVITFSEHAIQYYYRFLNTEYSEEADKYLSKAHEFITNESRTNEFITKNNNRKLNNLKKELEKINKAASNKSQF